jgi:hypothetical protein
LGHLDSQRSLPVFGSDKSGLSALAKKLRFLPEHSVAVFNAPEGSAALLTPGPRELTIDPQPGKTFDAVLLYAEDVNQLRRLGATAIAAAHANALLWIACPRAGAAASASDLRATTSWVQDDVLGEITSVTGYKPVAFVALDDNWTALRFKKV